jgi:hypothetical protein
MWSSVRGAKAYCHVNTSRSPSENATSALPAEFKWSERMEKRKRRRFKQTDTLQERLSKFAENVKIRADHMPPGEERDQLLKTARRADTAAHIDEWASSPGLLPPR